MKPFLSILALLVFSGLQLQAADSTGLFRHVVLLKFKAEATPDQIRNIEEEFRNLPEKIDTIVDFEWGVSKTVEAELARGYTHCFLVTFKDKAGLEVYLPHPAHTAFVDILKPLLEEVHVFDYVAAR